MRPVDWLRLVTLAALWGGAFMFMRVASPALGALLTAEIRVGLAGLVLGAYGLLIREEIGLFRHAGRYLFIGVVSSAIPFALYAFSAAHSGAGLNAIINATSPLYGAIAASIFLRDRLTGSRVLAILVGACGVWILAGDFITLDSPLAGWALAAALTAALCYGLAGVFAKLYAPKVSPLAMTVGTQLMAAVFLLPLLPAGEVPGPVTWIALGAAAALAIVASVFGYLLYFALLRDVGPVRTLYVTFLIPVFGIFWGVTILGESIGPRAIMGGALILVAVWLETRR